MGLGDVRDAQSAAVCADNESLKSDDAVGLRYPDALATIGFRLCSWVVGQSGLDPKEYMSPGEDIESE
jgi:hypothetical protein